MVLQQPAPGIAGPTERGPDGPEQVQAQLRHFEARVADLSQELAAYRALSERGV